MGAEGPSPEVEALARELCASEGWDPDERVECDAGEVPLAQRCAVSGLWSCARWHAYAPAAERLSAARTEAWETF